jgi:hypothetical protein
MHDGTVKPYYAGRVVGTASRQDMPMYCTLFSEFMLARIDHVLIPTAMTAPHLHTYSGDACSVFEIQLTS